MEEIYISYKPGWILSNLASNLSLKRFSRELHRIIICSPDPKSFTTPPPPLPPPAPSSFH